MCQVLQVSRSGYYAWLKRGVSKRSQENEALIKQIRQIFEQSRGSYGSPRIWAQLCAQGIKVSRPRVARLMRKGHIRSKSRRKYVLTSDSKHALPISPHLLDRNFEVGQLNRAWVSDISYLYTRQGWIYLTIILDLADRKVIGWSLSKSLQTGPTVIDAWKMAIANRKPQAGLIFHSDRGIQYAAHAFRRLIAKHPGIRQSMSRKGNCWDNAVAESFFKSLKTEWLADKKVPSLKEAQLDIFEYIEIWYNRKRRHSTLDYKTPAEFEQLLFNKQSA